jgi:hypothetical protein
MLKSVIHVRLYDKDGTPTEGFDVDEETFEPTKKGTFKVMANRIFQRAIICTKFGGAVTIQRGFEL